MKINQTYTRFLLVLPFFVLLNSCDFSDTFPLNIKDIDTLSVFQHYNDSVNIAAKLKNGKVEEKNTIQLVSPSEKWTICKGIFKVKQNARRMFHSLNKKEPAYIIIRNNMFYVTSGKFLTKDSALSFKKTKKLTESFLLETKPEEQYLQAFPD